MSLRDERNIARAEAHLETKLRIEAEQAGREAIHQLERTTKALETFKKATKQAIAATKALTAALEILIDEHPDLQAQDTGEDF